MSSFHLMHCMPDARIHGPNGYLEVIETLAWGLEQLGFETTYAKNRANPRATNIIFGAQMPPIDFLQQLPRNSIVYQMEQVRNLRPSEMRPEARYIAEHFEIWDFSDANLDAWRSAGATRVKTVRIGYAPLLRRIDKPATQDIDVLLYGMSGAKRLRALHELSSAGLVTVFASGLYGAARDALIARSKLVLNVNLYDFAQIFEVVRVSYLLANKKAVVALKDPATFCEPDIERAVQFSTPDGLIADCRRLLSQDALRLAMEEQGFKIMESRDIRSILREALGTP